MAILLPPGSSGSIPAIAIGTTLRDIRQFLAREVGPFQPGRAAATSTQGALVDTRWPVKSTLAQKTLFRDHLLFRPNASADDQLRTVADYLPATGTLTPDLAWGTAPGDNEAYELLGTIDPLELHNAINDALDEILVATEFTIVPVPEQDRHYLPPDVATWLTEAQWIRQVGFLDVSEDRQKVDPYRNRVIRGGASKIGGRIVLEHPGRTFDPAQTVLYVKTMSKAASQCAPSGGIYGQQRVGLLTDTDITEVDKTWVAATALVEIWRRHGRILEPAANQRLIRDRGEATAWKTDQFDEHLDVPPLMFLDPIQHWGPQQPAGGWGLGV